MASFTSDQSLPLLQVLIRERDALGSFECESTSKSFVENNPIESSNDEKLDVLQRIDKFQSITNIRLSPIYSPNGKVVCTIHEVKNLCFFNTFTGDLLLELPINDAQSVEFSPKGSYIVTWSRYTTQKASSGESTNQGNLKVWDISDIINADGHNGKESDRLLQSFSQKTARQQTIQWTDDEIFSFQMVSSGVHILPGRLGGDNIIIDKIPHKSFTQYKVSPTSIPLVSIAIFNPEQGGKPAKVTLYSFKPDCSKGSAVEGPLSSRTVFSATEALMLWNSIGSSLLIRTHADVDSSNSSYYGATGLYIMQADGDISNKVEQSKDGPVNDVQWSPAGDRFVVAAGTMPCHTTLFNNKAEPLYQFGAAHRNTISWSPHGRFLVLAGFGNLAGEMDFWDMTRMKKLGSNTSHCSVTYSWSPDSRYFLTASLAPRMNVDNNFKVFKYNGVGPVMHQSFERLYDAMWRPSDKDVYPNRASSPKRNGTNEETKTIAVVAPPVAKAAPYRPPGSTGSLNNFMEREVVAAGKVKNGNIMSSIPSKYTPQKRVIPGMAPPSTTSNTSGNNNNKTNAGNSDGNNKKDNKNGKTKKNSEISPPVVAVTAVVEPPVPMTSNTIITEEDTPIEKEKRAKAIRKKLKQIEEIKAKRDSGTQLSAEQVAKISTEAELIEKLKELEV
eukprot:gene10437-14020_t